MTKSKVKPSSKFSCHLEKIFNLLKLLHQQNKKKPFLFTFNHTNKFKQNFKFDRFETYVVTKTAVRLVKNGSFAQICENSKHERLSFSISYIFYKICKSAFQCRAIFSPPSFRKRLSLPLLFPERSTMYTFFIF